MTDPFKILGLKRAKATEAEVKVAYARLLKTTRPEEDRAAFMALRAAFENARRVAKFNDQNRKATASKQETEVQDGEDVSQAPIPNPEPEKQAKWYHDAELNWHFDDTERGKLIEQTIRWMVKGGQDRAAFSAETSEGLIGLTEADQITFRASVIEFIMTAADPDERRYDAEVWKPFKGGHPPWMSEDVIAALHDDLGLLRSKPKDAHGARSYNTVLDLFEQGKNTTPLDVTPIDVVEMFEAEETAALKDNHGSYFDRDNKMWVDMSPVSVAMRDLQAAFDRNLWDLTDTCRNILHREELQALDEFQTMDARLQQHIASATGFQTDARKPVHPTWLRTSLLELFDDHFGWTRHYGRHPWERQQYHWLHRVINRDTALAAEVTWLKNQQLPTQTSPESRNIFGLLFARPRNLLIGYFGFRVVQVLWRLVS